MIKGLLVVNAYLGSKRFFRLYDRLESAAASLGIALVRITNEDVICGRVPEGAAFALFWDKDIFAARSLQARGLRVFNSPDAISVCDDKAAMQLCLERAGLPVPETIAAPLAFEKLDRAQAGLLAQSVAESLLLPVVVKETHGSFGAQVRLAVTMDELTDMICEISPRPLIFQHFIAGSRGADTRVYVVGDSCIAAMRRNHAIDFRSNADGNTVFACQPTDAQRKLALDAVRACGLSFGGVDILDGNFVCEVNSNALFLKTEACTGIDIAGAIFKHILSEK